MFSQTNLQIVLHPALERGKEQNLTIEEHCQAQFWIIRRDKSLTCGRFWSVMKEIFSRRSFLLKNLKELGSTEVIISTTSTLYYSHILPEFMTMSRRIFEQKACYVLVNRRTKGSSQEPVPQTVLLAGQGFARAPWRLPNSSHASLEILILLHEVNTLI